MLVILVDAANRLGERRGGGRPVIRIEGAELAAAHDPGARCTPGVVSAPRGHVQEGGVQGSAQNLEQHIAADRSAMRGDIVV